VSGGALFGFDMSNSEQQKRGTSEQTKTLQQRQQIELPEHNIVANYK